MVTALYTARANMRVKLAENNIKQADYIDGAEVLKNPRGTAPGQWLETEYQGQKRLIMLLPGPPHEMEGVFTEHCIPRLEAALPEVHLATCELKIAMVAESAADLRAAKHYKNFPGVETTILAKPGEVQLHLKARAATREEAETRLDKLAVLLEEEFAEEIFPAAARAWSRLSATFCRCAAPPWPWPKAAPAGCWASASPVSAAARDTFLVARLYTATSSRWISAACLRCC